MQVGQPSFEHEVRNRNNRRDFIKVAGGAALSAIVFGACGEEREGLILPKQTLPDHRINFPASANALAERGEMTQLSPPPPAPFERRGIPGGFYMNVDVERKLFSFTFDDGPSPYNTGKILDILSKYKIRATFFLVGVNVLSWPEIAQRIVAEGHEVGNHSHLHSPYSAAPLASQIPVAQEIIRVATGVIPIAHRAPGLTRGQIILDTCAVHGLSEYHTSMVTTDYLGNPRRSADYLVDEFIRGYSPGDFGLYHDGGGPRPTPDALERMIVHALMNGYEFVTASEMAGSGVGRPGTQSYSALTLGSEMLSDSEVYVDTCNYNAEEFLSTYVNDMEYKTAKERSNITSALAEISDAKKQE